MPFTGTPGAANKVNRLAGISKIVNVTAADVADGAYGLKVFEAGILLKFANGKVYLSDGVTALKNLQPLIDQALTEAEKAGLAAAYSTGSYVRAASGVVQHDATGQIADDSIKAVEQWDSDGAGTMVANIKESYLQKYIDPSTHKVRLEYLPDTVRAGVSYVANIAARDALVTNNDERLRGLVFVIDASADTNTTAGAAMYAYVDNPEYTGEEDQTHPAKVWEKIAEVESLDIDVSDIECSYENMQARGAVLYNHTVVMTPPSLTDLAALDTEGTLGGTVPAGD